MVLVDQPHEPLLKHMRVDLCRRNVGMAKELLDCPQVRSVLQQMAGKGMTKDVGRNPRGGNAGAGGECLQLPGKDLPWQMAAVRSSRKKKRAVGQGRTGGARLEPRLHGGASLGRERHHSFLLALATHDEKSLVP